jgi:hypothetical protein
MEPWIGSRWGEGDNIFGGIRLLLLGESTHAIEHPIGASPETFIIDTVKQFLDRDERWRFYRVGTALLANTVAGQLTPDVTRAVWESIAFFNLVPVVSAQGPREGKPKDEMFMAGAKPFLAFLRDKSPEAVLVIGRNTWYWLLTGIGFPGVPWQVSTHDVDGIPMARTAHFSSSAFTYEESRPVLKKLLKDARELTEARQAGAGEAMKAEASADQRRLGDEPLPV